MVSKEFYIRKFGVEIGELKYANVEKDRIKRAKRQELGRSVSKETYTTDDINSGVAIKCEECGVMVTRLQWTHFRNKCTGGVRTISEYKSKYPNAPLVSKKVARLTGFTLQYAIDIYGEIEGPKRWEEYTTKQAITNTFDYKRDVHGWDEDQYDEYNKSRSSTLTNFIERHGEELGNIKWKEYCDRQSYTNTIEYFIEKFGESGKDEWEKCNKEKAKPHSIPYIMETHNCTEEEAIAILYSRYGNTYSQSSINECHFIDAFELELGSQIKYTNKTSQYGIWSPEYGNIFFYDMTCTIRRKIIEYNGDYWHANPTTYQPTDSIHGTMASDIWVKERLKLKAAHDRGFDVLVIWESEYLSNKNQVLTEALKWWNQVSNGLK